MLRWNLPRGMTQIIIYTVYVNISRTGTEFFLNSTMRKYTLENPCSDVLFKVTAWDDIGEGNGTTLLYRHNSSTGEEDNHCNGIGCCSVACTSVAVLYLVPST